MDKHKSELTEDEEYLEWQGIDEMNVVKQNA